MIDALAFGCGHPRISENVMTNGVGRTRCRTCSRRYQARWHEANKPRIRELQRSAYQANPAPAKDRARRYRLADPERHRRYHDRSKYGVTRDDLAQACEVCGSTENLHIDHDHGTGVVRGRLCKACNLGIGYFGDDADRLRAAARYLDDR